MTGTGPRARALRAAALAGLLAGTAAGATAQTPATGNWLRLEGAQQADRQALRQEQRGFRGTLGPLAPAPQRDVERRLLGERLEQQRLHQRQHGAEAGARARRGAAPLPEPAARRDLRLQGYRTQQRRLRLQQGIERRGWSYVPYRRPPPRPTFVGPP